ncbi:MAG: hypothetical protein AABW68_04600, partial [archaeon]
SADILGDVIKEHVMEGASLDEYPRRMESIFKELELHYKIHQYQSRLSDGQVDRLFLKLKDAGVEQFLSEEGDMDEPTQFIGKLLSNPRIISFLPEAISFAMTK